MQLFGQGWNAVKTHRKRVAVILVLLVAGVSFIGVRAQRLQSQPVTFRFPPPVNPPAIPAEGLTQNDTRGFTPGDAANAVQDLKRIFQAIEVYRQRHRGSYPDSAMALLRDMGNRPQDLVPAYGFATTQEMMQAFTNPDAQYGNVARTRGKPSRVIVYQLLNTRPDGSFVGTPKPPGTRDLIAYTNIYFHDNIRQMPKARTAMNPTGFYVVLWDTGEVEKIPYDQKLFVLKDGSITQAFPTQAGLPEHTLTYDEYWAKVAKFNYDPQRARHTAVRGKPVPAGRTQPVPDNGGPEALMALVRLLTAQVEREQLWHAIGGDIYTKVDYSLQDIHRSAAKVGLKLALVEQSLDQLQQQGTVAILQLKNPDQLITLAAMDHKKAVVYDQGEPLTMERLALYQRYTGHALVPQHAQLRKRTAPLQTDAVVRTVKISDANRPVSGTAVITNTSQEAINVSLEPTCYGCHDTALSKQSLKPGESTTLTAGMGTGGLKERLVLLTLRTNDPARPRLVLGFQLQGSS